jgi:hypothetical protein
MGDGDPPPFRLPRTPAAGATAMLLLTGGRGPLLLATKGKGEGIGIVVPAV